jgi:transcriptional regulator with XRE-family HTH domain
MAQATAALYRYDKNGPLLQQPVQCPRNIQQIRSHTLSPSANQDKAGAMTKRYGELPNTLGEKIRSAFVRRIFPNTNLTRKQVIHALDISAGTFDNLLSGERDPSGRTLHKLVEFFGASFLQEIFGGPNIHVIDPREAQKATALRKLAEAHEELRRMA